MRSLAALAVVGMAALPSTRAACADLSFSCSRCIGEIDPANDPYSDGDDKTCTFAFAAVTEEQAKKWTPRYLPHVCIKKPRSEDHVDALLTTPSNELGSSDLALKHLRQEAEELGGHIEYLTNDDKGSCYRANARYDHLLEGEGGTKLERITTVIRRAQRRFEDMRAQMKPSARARDKTTWFQHIFDDEIDAVCDLLGGMSTEEQAAINMDERVDPSIDVLLPGEGLGVAFVARQLSRAHRLLKNSGGVKENIPEGKLEHTVRMGRWGMEKSCRYLDCIVQPGSYTVLDGIKGSDGKSLGQGTGVPCRFCRRLSFNVHDTRGSLLDNVDSVRNGLCSAMRTYVQERNDAAGEECFLSMGMAFVRVMRALNDALSDQSYGSDPAFDQAVTMLNIAIAHTGVCTAKHTTLGHWGTRLGPHIRAEEEREREKGEEAKDASKKAGLLRIWRASRVHGRDRPTLEPN